MWLVLVINLMMDCFMSVVCIVVLVSFPRLQDQNIVVCVVIVCQSLIITVFGKRVSVPSNNFILKFPFLFRLNQCIGELNYRYFLAFLVSNSSFFFYATYVLSWILLQQVVSETSCLFLLNHFSEKFF